LWGFLIKEKKKKKLCPGTPGKHPGKVHLLMFCIKGAGLEKTSLAKVVGIFSKLAPLIQNIGKCTFPGCFPGVSWVFPGFFPGVLEQFFFSFSLLKFPRTFAKEVFF
jgi:hypothetical protein